MKAKKKDKLDHLDDIDVYVEAKGMSREEELLVSEYIRQQKAKGNTTSKSKRKRAA